MQNFVTLSNNLVTGLVQMKTRTVNFHLLYLVQQAP